MCKRQCLHHKDIFLTPLQYFRCHFFEQSDLLNVLEKQNSHNLGIIYLKYMLILHIVEQSICPNDTSFLWDFVCTTLSGNQ